MPFWAYTTISGVSAIAMIYALICLIKPFGIFRRRWQAALGLLAIAILGTTVYSIPPARPPGIEAQDWTRRVALCGQLDGSAPTCLEESLALPPSDAISSLEARLAAQNARVIEFPLFEGALAGGADALTESGQLVGSGLTGDSGRGRH